MDRVVILPQSTWDRLPVRIGIALANHAAKGYGFTVTSKAGGQPIEGDQLRNYLIGVMAFVFPEATEGAEHESLS